MADLTITPANVHAQGEDTRIRVVQFGDAMAAGKAFCYAIESGVQKAFLADATTASGLTDCKGVVLVGAADDGYGVVCEGGPIDVGATLTAGTAYILSETAGGIAPAADFSGYTSATQVHIGYASATDQLEVKPFATGATT